MHPIRPRQYLSTNQVVRELKPTTILRTRYWSACSMADKKPFINPLTRPSDANLHVPIVPDTQANTQADAATATSKSKRAKSREEVFEATHQRFTGWVDK